jgi:hypothetical protein
VCRCRSSVVAGETRLRAWPVELLPELQAYQNSHPNGRPIFNEMLPGGSHLLHPRRASSSMTAANSTATSGWRSTPMPPGITRSGSSTGGAVRIRSCLVVADSGFDRYLSGASETWSVEQDGDGSPVPAGGPRLTQVDGCAMPGFTDLRTRLLVFNRRLCATGSGSSP